MQLILTTKEGSRDLEHRRGADILQAFADYYTRDPRMCGLYPHSAADAMVDHGCISFLFFLKKSFVYLKNPTVRHCKMNTLVVKDDTPRSNSYGEHREQVWTALLLTTQPEQSRKDP